MGAVELNPVSSFWKTARAWVRGDRDRKESGPRIGLALGGGFARGIAHIGVLRALERNNIPIHAIAGVSSGAIVAAAFASGSCADEIEAVAISMKFRDIARWTLNLRGLAGSDRMITFLTRLLKVNRFEEMKIPLAVVATDLIRGQAMTFHRQGDAGQAIRASCAYPGLFQPIRHEGKLLVDGFVSMEVPAEPLLQMGVDRVISVVIPNCEGIEDFGNMFSVVNRCFQVMSSRTENSWRRYSSLVLAPGVGNMAWDAFPSAKTLIQQGEQAAMAALPTIHKWLGKTPAPSIEQQKGHSLPITA